MPEMRTLSIRDIYIPVCTSEPPVVFIDGEEDPRDLSGPVADVHTHNGIGGILGSGFQRVYR
jgi:hypothetical protein